jgi:60 kDa SS-A/Ro ribonucleoprotein
MFDFTQHVSTRLRRTKAPQAEPIPNSAQGPDSARGHVGVDDWTRLDRFLIFGSERGTYYVRAAKHTAESASAVKACLATDGVRVVRRVVEISKSGRAPQNDAALLVLAVAASAKDEETRAAALAAFPRATAWALPRSWSSWR